MATIYHLTTDNVQKINDTFDSINSDLADQDSRINNIVGQAGSSNTEIVDARTNARGKIYDVLKDRLDAVDIDLEGRAVNVKWYGASGSSQTTTGSIASGSTTLTVPSSIDFVVGQGIAVEAAGAGSVYEVASLQITAAATVSGNVTVTLDGVATEVAVVAGDSTITIADKIRNTTFSGWAVGGLTGSDTVTFTANTYGDKQDAAYMDTDSTGATGITTTTIQGVSDLLVTSITDISGTAITLADAAGATVSDISVYHEDSAAFLAAINVLPSTGGNIVCPRAIYPIGKVVTIPDNVTILAQGSTFLSLWQGKPSRLFQNSDLINGNNEITFVDAIFEGNEVAGSYTTGDGVATENMLRFENVIGLSFRNCFIQNFRNNKDTSASPPDTIYPVVFSSCTNVNIEKVSQTGIVNNEGIYFINCENVSIDRFNSNNTQCWTPLHLYYCDTVTIKNSKIFEDVGKTWASSTINMFSKNVRFVDCFIQGGAGIDISNEVGETGFASDNIYFESCYINTTNGFYNSVASLVTNFQLDKVSIDSVQRAFAFYGMSFDGFHVTRCNFTGSDGNNIGINMDTTGNAYFHHVRIIDNKWDNYETPIRFYLKDGKGFKDVLVTQNDIKCSPLGGKDSYSGSSVGIFAMMNTANANPSSYFDDVRIIENYIDAEGGNVLLTWDDPTNTANISVHDLVVKDNHCQSSRNPIARGIQLYTVNRPDVEGNIQKTLAGFNVFENCSDIKVNKNHEEFVAGGGGWRFESCTGFLIAKENTYSGTAPSTNHFYTAAAANAFTTSIVTENIPNTVDASI